MTAGRGIAHSEVSVGSGPVLRGVQLWVVQPDHARTGDPGFENVVPERVELDGSAGTAGSAAVRVFIGSLAGLTSTATVFSPLLGAEVRLAAGAAVEFDVAPEFEHGVLVDDGEVRVGEAVGGSSGAVVRSGELAYLPPGARRLALTVEDGSPNGARLLLLGGEPLGERIVMWWNFIGRDHDEVVEFRRLWQDERAAGFAGTPAHGRARFGAVPGWAPDASLPAPVLPGGRLRPRG